MCYLPHWHHTGTFPKRLISANRVCACRASSPNCGIVFKQVGSSNFLAEPINQGGTSGKIGLENTLVVIRIGLVSRKLEVNEVLSESIPIQLDISQQKTWKFLQDVEKCHRTSLGRALRMRLMRTAEGLEARSLRRHEPLNYDMRTDFIMIITYI